MVIRNNSLCWTKNPNFGPKNADVIKNILRIQNLFKFYESCYKVLVVRQTLAVKRYPIKS